MKNYDGKVEVTRAILADLLDEIEQPSLIDADKQVQAIRRAARELRASMYRGELEYDYQS